MIWGTIIMGVTGLMIWFKMDVTRFLPRWAVEVATTIHYYEGDPGYWPSWSGTFTTSFLTLTCIRSTGLAGTAKCPGIGRKRSTRWRNRHQVRWKGLRARENSRKTIRLPSRCTARPAESTNLECKKTSGCAASKRSAKSNKRARIGQELARQIGPKHSLLPS